MAHNIDDDLNQVERDIRTLKIEYEQFFGGGRPRPPADTQWRVETVMRRFNERAGDLSSGQRFRYNNLAQTYAKYVEMWRKKTMQKEGSAHERHFGAAAKAIEAERARKAASQPPPIATPSVPVRPVAGREQGDGSFAMSFSDPEHEHKKVETLYQKLIEARATAGEKTGGPSLKDFERFVQQKSKELKDKGGQDIEYTVNIEGGRVKLKARIAR
jgi:hypothetical protein